MGRWLMVLILTSAAATAKDEIAAPAQPGAGRTKALENALRDLQLFDLKTGRKAAGNIVRLLRENAGEPRCAHIQVIPVNPQADPGIRIGIPDGNRGDRPAWPMRVYPGLPACGDDRR